jgi:hypothetical protein
VVQGRPAVHVNGAKSPVAIEFPSSQAMDEKNTGVGGILPGALKMNFAPPSGGNPSEW